LISENIDIKQRKIRIAGKEEIKPVQTMKVRRRKPVFRCAPIARWWPARETTGSLRISHELEVRIRSHLQGVCDALLSTTM